MMHIYIIYIQYHVSGNFEETNSLLKHFDEINYDELQHDTLKHL